MGRSDLVQALLAHAHYEQLYPLMQKAQLGGWAEKLPQQLSRPQNQVHGDLEKWWLALQQLPRVVDATAEFSDTIRINAQFEAPTDSLEWVHSLRKLMPWRKGPYQINQIKIDTEWRSDFKWQRLQDKILPLNEHRVLDVGCGNGYHCWRMFQAGAKLVIGIDPSWLFLTQFLSIRHFLHHSYPVFLLPLGIEQLPANLQQFDTVFSMGVFYHRRSPIDHLLQLKNTLRCGGQLILETLIVAGEAGYSLLPADRYAKMRNVWFIPTVGTLKLWLQRCGFRSIQVVDISPTTAAEQRRTPWMESESLTDFLDPLDQSKTIEGYPAPCRAIIQAIR